MTNFISPRSHSVAVRPYLRRTPARFIALVLALSVAITSLAAAPARANDDLGRFIAGVVALGIIGAAINDAKDDRDRRRDRVQRRHDNAGIIHAQPIKPLPQRLRRYDLPGECMRSLRSGGEQTRFMAKRCLRRNYAFANELPGQCRITVANGNQRRQGYRPRCLRRHGFRIVNG